MKVKMFSKCNGYFGRLSAIASSLEEDVNDWLEIHPEITIIDIKQTSCGGSLEASKHILSIWYRNNNQE